MSRDFPPDKLKDRVTVKLTSSGKVSIIFLVEGYFYESLPSTGKKAGIDIGIDKLLIVSEGYYVPNPRPYKRALKKVKVIQKELSRKKPHSKNREKARLKLALAYERLDSSRKDLYMKFARSWRRYMKQFQWRT